ncbi:hypothetical protein C8F01DRAFT_8067 [Mycena amicta]|nr:hypothetical protein C8F01DRAFT_8067 [Mycena amicta]
MARLRLAEHTGTVKYSGPVDGTAGLWLGVEWDDPSRGKHDGVKDGRRYFTCRIPNAGSFIRPTAKDLSYGSSFLEALHAKYVEQSQGSQETVLLGSSNGAIQVEAVDLDKIRAKFANLEKLREVSLDTDFVARYDGPPGSIRATCPNVRGLDLSKNLISSWDTISAICSELPNLQRLSLNRTRLTLSEKNYGTTSFANLIELRLNATLTTWHEMQLITGTMPRLRIVEIGYNRLDQLCSSVPGSAALESINLDSNSLRDWNLICTALIHYPALDRVVLTSNLIDTIPPPPRDQTETLRLEHISLSHNRLTSWTDIDSLSAWCPNLRTLTMLGNPLFDDPVHGRSARQLTIARIPSLEGLDAGAISFKERADSELFYLSYIAQHGPKFPEARIAAHPRWEILCEKHGRPDERADHHQETLSRRLMGMSPFLQRGLVHLSLTTPLTTELELNVFRYITTVSPGLAAPPNNPIHLQRPDQHITLRALPTMTLRALRLKLCKTTKRSPGNTAVSLWLQMQDNSYAPLSEDRDEQDLAWLGVEAGSNIIFTIHDK